MADQNRRPEQDGEHRFGSVHTIVKLETLSAYLPAYTTALKNLPFRLHYVDAFAGTGVCHIKIGDRRLLVPGSATIAINCTPRFHQMLFIEKSRRKVRALTRLTERLKDRQIIVVQQDANDAIPEYLATLGKKDRAMIFLDPFGMQLSWQTLEAVAESKISDAWYLFPLSALYRQAARDASALDAEKEAALTRMLGTDAWRTAFYEQAKQFGLFGQSPDERTADWSNMLEWVQRRLQTIFAGVLEPKLLYQTRQDGSAGAPLFALFFAVSNPSSRARELAMRLARAVLKP